MTKRRSLVSGIKGSEGNDPSQEAAFVYGTTEPSPSVTTNEPPTDPMPEPVAEVPEANLSPAAPAGRLPLTTRLRSDLALALKRASLERQLAGQTPNTVQDILELALEPWLKDHGYLK